MSIRVIQPGILTTVQDAGRFGYMDSGIGPGGVMDAEAYAAGNLLTGNPPDAAVLEMTLAGITAQFTEDTVIALTGADMNASLDGVRIPAYQRISVRKGQTLSMGSAVRGLRAYLAVAGGIDTPPVMGSRSTNLKCHFGGYEGRPLQAGDTIPVGRPADSEGVTIPCGEENRSLRPDFPGNIQVRVVAGPQADAFTVGGWETFLTTRYVVTSESDRMGMRLAGPPIESVNGVDIVSDGIVSGSVQVPKSGTPIILMTDHQTTGGYAKIATVCSFDLPKLAQLRPGQTVSFRRISVKEAQNLYCHPELRNRTPDLKIAISAGRRAQENNKQGRAGRRTALYTGMNRRKSWTMRMHYRKR